MDNNQYRSNDNQSQADSSEYRTYRTGSYGQTEQGYQQSHASAQDGQNRAYEQNVQSHDARQGGQTAGYGQGSQTAGYGQGSQTAGYSQGTQAHDSRQAGWSQNRGYGQTGGYGQSTDYRQNYYQTQPTKPEKKKKIKKSNGFGMKVVKCACLALVFGLVGGAAFEGVRHISGAVWGSEETAVADDDSTSVLIQNPSDSDAAVSATPTSAQYVATDVSDIVDASMPSIVAITNVSQTEYQSFWGGRPQTYESTSAGSGIIVSQDDDYLYIVTNNHVVDGATSLTVTFNDESTVSADIKGTDPSTDLAVIKVAMGSIESDTLDNIKVATLGDSDALRVGQASIAIGNALGYGQSVTTGCISALNREVSVSDSSSNTSYTAELIQTDAAINPGNSGGALLNAKGEVIGINSVKYSDTSVEGIGYAIPISTAMPIIEDLITKEKVDESDSAYLGIAGVDVTSDVASTYSMPTGVYVAQVIEGSAAENAGLIKGDIITAFDGKEISSMEELTTRLQYYAAGDTVEVTIQRASNGQYEEQTVSVVLGKKK